MRISTNVASSFAIRRLGQVRNELDKDYKSLSSGDRITMAANDPAGLAISEGLKARSRSLSMARRNANDGISFFQLAEGNFNTLQAYGTRLRELAMQSASGSYGDQERLLISKEFNAVKSDMKRITKASVSNIYGGKDSQDIHEIQIGVKGEKSTNRLTYNTKEIFDTDNYYGVDNIRVGSQVEAQNSLSRIDRMITKMSAARAKLGSYQAKLRSSINGLDDHKINVDESNSKIRDTDFAQAMASKTSAEIREAATTSMLTQANTSPQAVLRLI